MPTKGSTAGQSIEKIREREQARRDARKRPKVEPPKKQIRVLGFRSLVLVIKDRSPENLRVCYERLAASTLLLYFPKYKYHEHLQKAVMEGRLFLSDLPGELYVEVLSSMTKGRIGWTQGSMEVSNG